jgi:C4-dicarboxylate-specific signal transduction histidine kinase
MRYILLTLLLTGCSVFQKEAPPVVVSNNNEKDKYITKVEEAVSESASALTAVSPAIPVGVPRKIVEGQVERLSGISKPTEAKVKEFQRIIKENDSKAVEDDQKKAAKVNAETNKLWAEVEKKDKQLTEAVAVAERAEKTLREERKTKLILQGSLACLGLLVFGVLVIAFSPLPYLKKAGAIVVALAVLLWAGLMYFV